MIDHQVQPSLHHHVMLLTKVWICGILTITKKKKPNISNQTEEGNCQHYQLNEEPKKVHVKKLKLLKRKLT